MSYAFHGKRNKCFKKIIFRDQFNISEVYAIYVFLWCSKAISAHKQDYDFVLNAVKYAKIDSAASNEILREFSNHVC